MDTPSVPNKNNEHKSELDKFKIFFEISKTTKEERDRINNQNRS